MIKSLIVRHGGVSSCLGSLPRFPAALTMPDARRRARALYAPNAVPENVAGLQGVELSEMRYALNAYIRGTLSGK